MSDVPFGERLAQAVKKKKNAVCVGLDPRLQQLPENLRIDGSTSFEAQAEAFRKFCFEIIDVTHDLVPIVKPQSAFFEELGPHGVIALERVVRYATSKGLLVVMDAKRGDIGTTAAAYAYAYLGTGAPGTTTYSPFGADALTVNAFLGTDTLKPFVDRCKEVGAGLFILVKTSNPGSSFLQDLRPDGVSVSERLADQVQSLSIECMADSRYGSIGAVVGATYPQQLEAMRERMPNAWILVPGYGAQGGSAEDVCRAMDANGLGAIVNSSRGIIFAYEQPKFANANWQESVRNATLDMIDCIARASSRR